MIRLSGLGYEFPQDKINKKFHKADEVFKTNGLFVRLNTTDSKYIYGMVYLPPLKSEVCNFTISKNLYTHPYWDYVDIPYGPQITWFTVYKRYRGKNIATSVYEGIINKFGALYSDHNQTDGGTGIWKSILKNKTANVYKISWRKKDWKITSVKKQNDMNLSECFIENDIQTILLAVPRNKTIKEFDITNVEESITLANSR